MYKQEETFCVDIFLAMRFRQLLREILRIV